MTPSWRGLLVSALHWGTVASLVSLSLALLGGSEGFAKPSSLLAPFAAGAAFFFLLHLVLSSAFRSRTSGTSGRGEGISAAIGGFVVLAACAWPVLYWFRHPSEDLSGRQLATTYLFFGTLIVLSCFALALSFGQSFRRPQRSTVITALAAAPLISTVLLFWTWAQVHLIEGLLSVPSALVTAVCILISVGAIAIATWLIRRYGTMKAFMVPTSLAILVVAVAAWNPSDGPAAVGQSPEGPQCTVLLTVDTLRADAISALNPQAQTTPAIDEIFADSIVFTQARSAAPWTKPSMASVLTGLPPLVHGITTKESIIPDRLTTLAEYLAAAGYETGAVGRNYFLTSAFGFDQGFVEYEFFPRVRELIDESPGGALLRRLFPDEFPGEGTPEVLTDRSLEWITRHAGGSFFFWLHYFDPHMPLAPPGEFVPGAPPPTRYPASFELNAELRAGLLTLTGDEQRWIKELYLAEVRQVDFQIGRLIEKLRELNLFDPCLIAFSSDHGEEFWEHRRFEHGHTLFDEVLRIPLAIKPPGHLGRRDLEMPVSNASLTPTLLDLLDVPAARSNLLEPSLRPLWDGSESVDPPTHPVMTGMLYFEPRTALLLRGHKLIQDTESGDLQIFDLHSDSTERTPLRAVDTELLHAFERMLSERKAKAESRRRALGLPLAEETIEISPQGLRELKSLGYLQ